MTNVTISLEDQVWTTFLRLCNLYKIDPAELLKQYIENLVKMYGGNHEDSSPH